MRQFYIGFARCFVIQIIMPSITGRVVGNVGFPDAFLRRDLSSAGDTHASSIRKVHLGLSSYGLNDPTLADPFLFGIRFALHK